MLFFDAGGTLLEPRESVGVVYARAAARQGITVSPEQLLPAILAAFQEQKLDGRPQDRAWWREIVARTFAPLGTPRDPDALFEDLYTHFQAPDSWRLFPRAKETIETLQRRGYRTGLISNWDDRLPGLLRDVGLAPLLDPTVISYRVGAEKPAPKIFEVALEEAGVAPEEALMIGDDLEADVEGATRLGLEAIHVRRRGERANGVPVIDRLVDLLDLLPGAPASWSGSGA